MNHGERHGHKAIPMTKLETEDIRAPLGAYWFCSDPDGQLYIGVMIPSHKCFIVEGRTSVLLPISRAGEGHNWKWDGDENRPTLSPSIGVQGEWHGQIIDGRLVEC